MTQTMQLFYREKGISSNPPLIILHGLWGASDNWLTVAGLLSSRYHVILPDLRNHGNSPHAGECSLETLGKDISELIDRLHIERKTYIAGHSLGGKVLMHLLLQNPGLIAKAAVIDILPVSYPPSFLRMHRQLLDFILRFPLRNFQNREELCSAVRSVLPTEELCQILFKNIRKRDGQFEWKINADAFRLNLSQLTGWKQPPHASPYPYPVLFVKGGDSNYIETSRFGEMHALFPLARLITLPHASHRIHAERPQELADILQIFFGT